MRRGEHYRYRRYWHHRQRVKPPIVEIVAARGMKTFVKVKFPSGALRYVYRPYLEAL